MLFVSQGGRYVASPHPPSLSLPLPPPQVDSTKASAPGIKIGSSLRALDYQVRICMGTGCRACDQTYVCLLI